MTNTEIIIAEAVEHGIYTQEQIDEFLAIGQLPPLHTYAEWQALGYKVKPGEHACVTTKLWKPAPAKKEQDEAEEEEPDFYLVTAHLFDGSQVEYHMEVTA